jgi:hypothetical protein
VTVANRKKRIAVAILAVAILGLGLFGYFLVWEGSGVTEEDRAEAKKPDIGETAGMGLNPDDGRLQNGAKRIEDPQEAIRMAREALTQVEREIAKTPEETPKTSLVKRQELIKRTIENLEESTGQSR